MIVDSTLAALADGTMAGAQPACKEVKAKKAKKHANRSRKRNTTVVSIEENGGTVTTAEAPTTRTETTPHKTRRKKRLRRSENIGGPSPQCPPNSSPRSTKSKDRKRKSRKKRKSSLKHGFSQVLCFLVSCIVEHMASLLLHLMRLLLD